MTKQEEIRKQQMKFQKEVIREEYCQLEKKPQLTKRSERRTKVK